MLRLLIVAQKSEAIEELRAFLNQNSFACSVIPHSNGLMEDITTQSPDLLVLETDGHFPNSRMRQLTESIKQKRPLPIIALIAREKLNSIGGHLDVDDFLTSPYDARELALRIKRLLSKTSNRDNTGLIKSGDLVIDLAKCEASIEGKTIELTFKEYELLRFLASHRGHVFSRESLLDKVWGYDYYGGDRTVDVHIRRLRSKIDDAKHAFIETVRSVGYRFKKDQ